MHLEINPDPPYEPQASLFGDCITEKMQVGKRNKFLLLVSWQALMFSGEKWIYPPTYPGPCQGQRGASSPGLRTVWPNLSSAVCPADVVSFSEPQMCCRVEAPKEIL